MRHIVNFGLLFAFVALAVTGVMSFVLPFSLVTARVHIVAGLSTIILVLLHVLGRLKYFRKLVAGGSSAALSRVRLLVVVLASGGVVAAAINALPPTVWLIDQGYEARNSAQIVRASSLAGFGEISSHRKLVARATNDPTSHELSVYLSFREEVQDIPAIAVWAETSTGTMIETLHLEKELAFADNVDWHGSLTQRNHILPIWRNRYTAISGIGPDGKVDAVTGATDTHSFALDKYLVPGKDNKFIICVEVNVPADTNDSWSDPQIGQPSLLYTAYIKVDKADRYAMLELTGHGGGAESNGNIQYDVESITTARDLVDLLLVKLEEPRSEVSSL